MKTKILFLLLLLFTIPLFAAEQEGNKIPNSEKERNFQTAALFQGKKYDPFLKEIDRQIQDLIDRRITPGAVVVLGRKDRIVFCKAYGNRQEYPKPEKMTLDTLFDLASVSKVAATGLCVNILIDRKQLDLDQSV
ncbi:MAG: serine hydrolase domain-containing protein, partial [Planctomycetia bacterium]|nr:serine hydrolase domain-containing protein [Planctomycetia bacterium]